MDLQGIFQYPGILRVKNARYTQTHGAASPDVIHVECVPQPAGQINEIGNAQFTYGLLGVSIPDCRVDSSKLRWSTQGQVQHLKILDRRWRWTHRQVSGEYNIRDANGQYVSHLRRSARELGILLLSLLGESNVDVSGLPGDQYPLRQWVCSNVAHELDNLCDEFGCRVTLGFGDDPVRCVRLGEGQRLPISVDVMTVDHGVNGQDAPDEIAVCGDRILYEGVFELEPIGEDMDGTIRHIDDLSYAPPDGWETDDFKTLRLPTVLTDLDGWTESTRRLAEALAEKSVFKWYRPKYLTGVWEGSGSVPYSNANVININQFDILPYRAASADGAGEYAVNLPATVYGEHSRIQDWNLPTGIQTSNTPCDGLLEPVPYSASIGSDNVVRFGTKVIKLSGTSPTTVIATAPTLFLRAGFYLRDYDTWLEQRWLWSRQIRNPPIGGGTFSANLQPLQLRARFLYLEDGNGNLVSSEDCRPIYTGNASTNEDDLIAASEDAIDAIAPRFAQTERFDAIYRGLQPIRCDGAIRQVTFWVTDGDAQSPGFDGNCATIASFNTETDPYVTGYRQRREREVSRRMRAEQLRISDYRWHADRVPRRGDGR